MSLPWAIQEIHLPAEEAKGQQRRSIFNEDPWALRKCHQCHEVMCLKGRVACYTSFYLYMRTINVFCCETYLA
ncbi:unnamed protein product [Ectocarpus sp. 4 AP-2014]